MDAGVAGIRSTRMMGAGFGVFRVVMRWFAELTGDRFGEEWDVFSCVWEEDDLLLVKRCGSVVGGHDF